MIKLEYNGRIGGGSYLSQEIPDEVAYCDKCGKLATLHDPYGDEDYCEQCARKMMARWVYEMSVSELMDTFKLEEV